ncbi:hypothetical protein THAOC_19867, partial [Thalassiosira oceanica]
MKKKERTGPLTNHLKESESSEEYTARSCRGQHSWTGAPPNDGGVAGAGKCRRHADGRATVTFGPAFLSPPLNFCMVGRFRTSILDLLAGGSYSGNWMNSSEKGSGAFLFLSVPFRDTLDSNYDTNKTQLDEAPFGRADDDYGPGSEPPPHDRLRYVSTFMPSRRRPPAAVGKPSFPRFKVYYLPRRRVRFEPRPLDFRERDLPNAT